MQSLQDLYSVDTVVRDWDPAQEIRPNGNMADWWSHWSRALRLMKEVREAYIHHSNETTRPIYMQFMFPIQAYMSPKDREEYTELVGGRSFTLTDAFCMAKASEKRERQQQELIEERREDLTEDSEDEMDDESGVYGQVEEIEVEREYAISKLRNRHRSLNSKKRSTFQRPFKK